MDCLALPVSSLMKRRSWGSRLGYHQISEGDFCSPGWGSVTVVVGKERKEFLVDGHLLEEGPFRDLIGLLKKDEEAKWVDGSRRGRTRRVVFVDVDAILFEHMLWLLYNDSPSLSKLNLEEIIDFYAQD